MSVRKEPGEAERSWRVPVLLYHGVAKRGARATAEWRVTPRSFERQLSWLRDHGYTSVTVAQLAQALAGRGCVPEIAESRAVLITFDDAYADFHANAWPALCRHGFTALVHAVTDEVGGSSTWDRHLGSDVPLMSWAQLREISESGIEIGSHGSQHVRMEQLPPDELTLQLARSRTAIADQLGEAPSSLAYPWGSTGGAVQEAARAAGFSVAFGTREDSVSAISNPFDLERWTVTKSWTRRSLKRSLSAASP